MPVCSTKFLARPGLCGLGLDLTEFRSAAIEWKSVDTCTIPSCNIVLRNGLLWALALGVNTAGMGTLFFGHAPAC